MGIMYDKVTCSKFNPGQASFIFEWNFLKLRTPSSGLHAGTLLSLLLREFDLEIFFSMSTPENPVSHKPVKNGKMQIT